MVRNSKIQGKKVTKIIKFRRNKKRFLACVLCFVLAFSSVNDVTFAFAEQSTETAPCEHHMEHTEDCGYSEGVEGSPCKHEHTEACYTKITECTHTHTAECYSDGVLPGEGKEKYADACGHDCSEENGCITRTLNCTHEHDESCGYVETVKGTPCNYICPVCTGIESYSDTEPTETTEDTQEPEEPEPPLICELKIRYVASAYNEDQTQTTYVDIYPSYHIQIPYGYSYEQPSPTIDNYALADLDDAVISGTLTEVYKEILVVYKESINTAKYTVNYWTLNIDGSEPTKIDSLCYEGWGEIGTSVTVSLFSIPGYSWSNDDLLVYITADGNAVKNVYYVKSDKRKLVFRTGTGYAKTVEAYPGEEITAERAAIRDVDPTKPGYKFVDWDTTIASLPDQVIYADDGTEIRYSCYVSAEDSPDGQAHYYMPANDYIINAIWTEAPAQYRVVFWFEKADGSGYTNGGLDTHRWALNGAEVTANYYDRLIADERMLFGMSYDTIKNITTDDQGNPYNFVEIIYDKNGNEIIDSNGDIYKNIYDNPVGKTYAQYKSMPFFGFDYDHCDDIIVTADGHATLNVYYKREIWKVVLYNEIYSDNKGDYTEWRSIEGRYASVIPAVKKGESDDSEKLPTLAIATTHYNKTEIKNLNDPAPEDSFYDLRTSTGSTLNLEIPQVFSTEVGNGSHAILAYPNYMESTTATSSRKFYGAYENVSPDDSQNLDVDYDLFASSGGNNFHGTIQPTFIFDEGRNRGYTWEGAKFRYWSRSASEPEDTTPTWSDWKIINTTPRAVGTAADALKSEIANGEATIILWKDGVAYWFFNNDYTPSRYFYMEVILPRKKLDINFISHNQIIKTEELEWKTPLATYYAYKPEDTDTERFVGWYEDAELTMPVSMSDVVGYENNNIYAKWESKECTVYFDPRNGDPVTKVAYNYGDVVEAPKVEPQKEGFRFVGWYTEEVSRYLFIGELSGDLVLHAVWEPIEIAEYVVKHYLRHDNGTSELILETSGYDSIHKTVTVSALGNEYFFKNLYVVPDGSNPTTQTIDLSKSTLEERTATFYYKEMAKWSYTISYLDVDDNATKLLDDFSEETDLLSITVPAPTIILEDDTTWVPVRAIGQRLTVALAGAILTPSGENQLTIYYDELHTLSFILNGGTAVGSYSRSLVKQETTTVPVGPTKEGYTFLKWSENQDGTGRAYIPGESFTMPDQDVTLYAQWAELDSEHGSLTVSKTVSGSGASSTQDFTFTVTLDDETVNGTYGNMAFENGIATFTLKDGENKTAFSLPAGINYTVEESDNQGYTVTVNETDNATASGTIIAETTKTEAFNNYKAGGGGGTPDLDPTPDYGSVKITKTVQGNKAPEESVAYEFRVWLWNSSENAVSENVLYNIAKADGTTATGNVTIATESYSFSLKAGDSITFSHITVGRRVEVQEITTGDFITTISGLTDGVCVISSNKTNEVAFVNTYGGDTPTPSPDPDDPTPDSTPTPDPDPEPTPTPTPHNPPDDVPQTGDNSNIGLWIALACFSLLGMAVSLFGRNRRYKRHR